jgi:transcriptional regulator with XRE-family HTH domain
MAEKSTFYQQVGAKIRGQRKLRGLSQEALAEAVGMTRASMSNIEKGRQRLLLHTFHEIVFVLQTTAAALLPEPTAAADTLPHEKLLGLSQPEIAFIEAGIRTPQKGATTNGRSQKKN